MFNFWIKHVYEGYNKSKKMFQFVCFCKSYKNCDAVKNLNLEIQDGELYSLLGVNGAGKTTTIKMLSCLTQPTQGCATIYGFDLIKDAQNIKQIINVSPQETAIAPMLSVKENLEFICEIYGFCQNQDFL